SAAITAKDLMWTRPQKLFTTPMTSGDRNERFQMRSDALNGDDSFLSAIDDDSNLHTPPWLWSGNRFRTYGCILRCGRVLFQMNVVRGRVARVQSLPASSIRRGPGGERPFPLR